MKIFIILAVIAFINNFLVTIDDFVLMMTNLGIESFINIISLNNVFTYIKLVVSEIIYFIFFFAL